MKIRSIQITVALAVALLASELVAADAQPGDYIALHGEIIGCEPGIRVLDIAKVSPDGEVQFLDKYTIKVRGMNHQQVTDRITQAIAKKTGREPKSLHVSIVDAEKQAAISGLVLEAMVTWNCNRPWVWPQDSDDPAPHPVPPGEAPRYKNNYDERVARAIPPNKALTQTLDPTALFADAKTASA